MSTKNESRFLIDQLSKIKNVLIIQDIDGVCIPLVKDPLTRAIKKEYVIAVSKLKKEFMVLTCGEHEGVRGVNRIIEREFISIDKVRSEGLYLPGLAACGVEYQDRYGNGTCLGISKEEIKFLAEVPIKMEEMMRDELNTLFPNLTNEEIKKQAKRSICDTRFSPTINLNELFIIAGNNIDLKRDLQRIMEKTMFGILNYAIDRNLGNSFYLHKSPNLGKDKGQEIIKFAQENDIGTTDIQLIINGALKEAGLLVLINKYIKEATGESPLGDDFNVRIAPKSINELVSLCKAKINEQDMPTIVGVGDTITSNKDSATNKFLRGGSDRGFLTLVQSLGKAFDKSNKVIFVDSSDGEVYRPSVKNDNLNGITDAEDELKFDLILSEGHKEYIQWIKELASARS